ncbi:hypothetical protein ACGTN6_10740 [Halomonas sp. THAF12]|uniref:hypothetical protein n=1 Tax=Halomonas sp. B23F22_10 TaxID=3459515 RepID=UPI00373E1FF4
MSGRRVRRTGRAALAVLGLATALLITGCSYTPARIGSGPLVEFGGYHDGHRHQERRYHERRHRHDRRHDYHDRDDWKRRAHHRRHRPHRDDRQPSRFCPPGQAMKGRC